MTETIKELAPILIALFAMVSSIAAAYYSFKSKQRADTAVSIAIGAEETAERAEGRFKRV